MGKLWLACRKASDLTAVHFTPYIFITWLTSNLSMMATLTNDSYKQWIRVIFTLISLVIFMSKILAELAVTFLFVCADNSKCQLQKWKHTSQHKAVIGRAVEFKSLFSLGFCRRCRAGWCISYDDARCSQFLNIFFC